MHCVLTGQRFWMVFWDLSNPNSILVKQVGRKLYSWQNNDHGCLCLNPQRITALCKKPAIIFSYTVCVDVLNGRRAPKNRTPPPASESELSSYMQGLFVEGGLSKSQRPGYTAIQSLSIQTVGSRKLEPCEPLRQTCCLLFASEVGVSVPRFEKRLRKASIVFESPAYHSSV